MPPEIEFGRLSGALAFTSFEIYLRSNCNDEELLLWKWDANEIREWPGNPFPISEENCYLFNEEHESKAFYISPSCLKLRILG